MPIIKNCLSSISNILRNEKTSYSLIKTEQTGKLLNRKITTTPTPAKLLSYRNADLIKENYITEKVLSIFNIKRDFVAVRIQSNQFTDLKNKTIQGRNALNFMIMEKDTFNEKILNSNANLAEGTENKKWHTLCCRYWSGD
ncbi:hypothetical protein [Escherichia coli]|uniref:hypothetical protein n=1 Tax=Escherichia coli TaxID=562 RepID=UPI003856017A